MVPKPPIEVEVVDPQLVGVLPFRLVTGPVAGNIRRSARRLTPGDPCSDGNTIEDMIDPLTGTPDPSTVPPTLSDCNAVAACGEEVTVDTPTTVCTSDPRSSGFAARGAIVDMGPTRFVFMPAATC
jgi:hypothetical protein